MLKKDCWKILEIEPTDDHEEIRRARRTLMKKWHPDTVQSPEKKRKYTIRCAEINSASDQALKFADMQAATPQRNSRKDDRPKSQSKDFSRARPVISVVVMWIGIIVVFGFGISWMQAAPETDLLRRLPLGAVYISVSVILIAFGGLGLGIIDLFLQMLVIEPVLHSGVVHRWKIEAYEEKVTWFLVLFVNIAIFCATDLRDIYVHTIGGLGIWVPLFIPLWFALDWLRDFVIFNRVKKTAIQINQNTP